MRRKSHRRTADRIRSQMIGLICVLSLVLAVLLVIAALLPKNPADSADVGTSGTTDTTGTTGTTGTTSSTTASTPGASMAEMVVQSVEEEGQWVLVSTSYFDFRYPFAFSDLTVLEAENEQDHVALVFHALLQDTPEPVFTLWINREIGIHAGTLSAHGESYSVWVEVHEPREGLSANDVISFRAVQEILNDVLTSMVDSGAFQYRD